MSKKLKKFARFVKKMLKFVILKCSNHSITTRNYAVTYNKTIEEVPWQLGLKELKRGVGAIVTGGNSAGVFNFSPALHTIGISLQNSLSWNRAEKLKEHLMSTGRYLFIPFWGRKVKSVRGKIGQAKIRIKKTDRNNKIAANFVWEQLDRKTISWPLTISTNLKNYSGFSLLSLSLFSAPARLIHA